MAFRATLASTWPFIEVLPSLEHRVGVGRRLRDRLDHAEVIGSAISLRRSLPEEIGIHDPALLLFGFASDLLNVVHELAQIARHERSEEHTSELQSHSDLVCRLLLEKKK